MSNRLERWRSRPHHSSPWLTDIYRHVLIKWFKMFLAVCVCVFYPSWSCCSWERRLQTVSVWINKLLQLFFPRSTLLYSSTLPMLCPVGIHASQHTAPQCKVPYWTTPSLLLHPPQLLLYLPLRAVDEMETSLQQGEWSSGYLPQHAFT